MLNEALKILRKNAGLNQSQAAEKLDISVSYLCELEKNKKTPTLETIDKYAKTFKVPKSSILFLSENIDNTGFKGTIAKKVLSYLKEIHEK